MYIALAHVLSLAVLTTCKESSGQHNKEDIKNMHAVRNCLDSRRRCSERVGSVARVRKECERQQWLMVLIRMPLSWGMRRVVYVGFVFLVIRLPAKINRMWRMGLRMRAATPSSP